MTGENAGSLAETLAAGNAGSSTGSSLETLADKLAEQIALRERIAGRSVKVTGRGATREVYAYDVKYWTLEQAEAMPDWPTMEESDGTADLR